MRDWFASAFEQEYIQLYAHRDDKEAEQTVDWLVQELQLTSGQLILDAPCGAGRHARAFARRGFCVVGFDLSRELLALAKKQACATACVQWVRADLRRIPLLSETFDVVTNLFSSFGYFFDESENVEALQELVRTLKPGGWLVLDFMNAPHVRCHLEPFSERMTSAGWLVREWRSVSGQPPRVMKRTHITFPDRREKELFESVRLYEPEELHEALTAAGLVEIRRFGTYAGEPWTESSPRIIFLARKGK